MAEYYGIYDYKSLNFKKLGVFVFGLGDNSRLKKKISGMRVDLDTIIMAGILDRLSLLLYSFSNSKSKPKYISDILLAKEDKEKKIKGYVSGKEFEKRRDEILKRIGENNG